MIKGSTLLLIQRGTEPGKGLWSLPGGRVHAGESLRAAAARELLEETGLAGECGELVGWVERISSSYHFVIFDFAVTVDGNQEPTAGDDADAVDWFDLATLRTVDLVPGLLDFLIEHLPQLQP